MNEIEMSDKVFERAIMENIYMKGAVLSNCDFSGAEMVVNQIDRLQCNKNQFFHAVLNSIKMAKATLNECNFERSRCWSSIC